MTIKIKKQLGSDAVRDLIERATARARQLPYRSVQDPWPSSHRVISDMDFQEPQITLSNDSFDELMTDDEPLTDEQIAKFIKQ